MNRREDDGTLTRSLDWALERMQQAGYPIGGKVSLEVDPSLGFMGYARKEAEEHVIVVAEWALDSEMLGGLLLHELAHVYHTERNSPSHQSQILDNLILQIKEREGLTEMESRAVMDAFSHLQNILVDDAVFEILGSSREMKMVQRFFAGWISERPSGNPRLDAILLIRNAFAIASLKRRNADQPIGEEMSARNSRFLSLCGGNAKQEYAFFEDFLRRAKIGPSEDEFRVALSSYLNRVVDLMRGAKGGWADIR